MGSAPPAYIGPGDVTGWTAPYAFYSTYAMTAAIATAGTQAAFRLVRAGDSHQCDILATAAGPGNTTNCSTGGDNGQPVGTWMTSTTASGVTWYDQSGNARDMPTTNTTPFNLTGLSSKPSFCLPGNAAPGFFTNSSFTLVLTAVTYAAVSMRTAIDGTDNGMITGAYSGTGSFMGFNGTLANTVFVYAGGAFGMNAAATDNSPHALIGVINGANSILNVDGMETADGTVLGGGFFATIGQIGGDAIIHSYLHGCTSEGIYVVGIPSSGERAALISNQRTRFGF